MNPTARLLRDLVAIDSTNPPGNEAAVARCLATWLHDRGVTVEVDEYVPGRANVLAQVDGAAGPGPRLMFNTHLDVVPAAVGWDSSPFEPIVRDGSMYGRGTADAKGSLAAMAACLADLAAGPRAFRGSVELTGVSDEEAGSDGARHLLASDRPDLAVIGEPTDLRLMAAHKGSLRPVVEVSGTAAHAAQPHLGSNAVESMGVLLAALPRLRSVLARKDHPLVGRPTVTPVMIAGGEALNMVPERCRITFDRRMVPGESSEEVMAEFTTFLADLTDDHSGFRAEVVDMAETTGGPSETPADHKFVEACRLALAESGLPDDLAGLVVNCDMTHFRAVDVPTVVCGPGSPSVMHARNEHLHLDQLEQAVEVYHAIVDRVLGGRT